MTVVKSVVQDVTSPVVESVLGTPPVPPVPYGGALSLWGDHAGQFSLWGDHSGNLSLWGNE